MPDRSDASPVLTERTLGARLRAVRTRHGWRLSAPARRIGCSVGYLSQIERGSSSPSLRMMEPLLHSGEECGALLAGRMILEIDGNEWELHPGDAFHFSSTLPHRYRNPAIAEDARIVWVTSAPKSALPQE